MSDCRHRHYVVLVNGDPEFIATNGTCEFSEPDHRKARASAWRHMDVVKANAKARRQEIEVTLEIWGDCWGCGPSERLATINEDGLCENCLANNIAPSGAMGATTHPAATDNGGAIPQRLTEAGA